MPSARTEKKGEKIPGIIMDADDADDIGFLANLQIHQHKQNSCCIAFDDKHFLRHVIFQRLSDKHGQIFFIHKRFHVIKM